MKNLFYDFILFSLIASLIYSCSLHNKSKVHKGNFIQIDSIIQNENIDSSKLFKGVFDLPEITLAPSPSIPKSIYIDKNENIIDYDVSPLGPIIAAIVKDKNENYSIKFWQVSQSKFSDSCAIFKDYTILAVTWHPRENALFIIGLKNKIYHILKVEKDANGWKSINIFTSSNELKRLIACPRPFVIGYNPKTENYYYSYRLFFGITNEDNTFRIVSITETGNRFYQVIGPEKSITHFEDEEDPSNMKANWALPVAFHPAGHQLIWEDKNQNLFVASYGDRIWTNYLPMVRSIGKVGAISPTPNGLGLLHWQKDKLGIGIYLLNTNKEEIQIPEYQFLSKPMSVPDGRGIVGLIKINEMYALTYVPIKVPMSDVVNAWMFLKSQNEMDLFQRNYGLFRINEGEQLYDLYETESYRCNEYDMNTPARPFMVTTDIFWELFGAAYQGLFIIKERDNAIPYFWKFIASANQYCIKTKNNTKWAPVFETLSELNSNNNENPEVKRIYAQQSTYSDILKDNFNYSELKPRGHYTSTLEMQKYFMAFKYFTTIYEKESNIMEELNLLPDEIKDYAVHWVESYKGLISNSRSPLIWKGIKYNPPSYNEYPNEISTIFPLSWGIDNEVFYSTVYHQSFPVDKQIIGKGGPRLLPSGLDLASALGDRFAENLLESDYEKYPQLSKVINHLKENYRVNCKNDYSNINLYDKWLNALAVQWVDTVNSPNGNLDKNIFNTKRLQTGLASWATLRHTTILVNERDAAECGEGGFEDIVMRAPRGYVEPDPYTFKAIAELFETAIKYVPESIKGTKDSTLNDEQNSLYASIVNNLKETAEDARLFQSIAEKEKRGENITNDEYEQILYVGREAENEFLMYESLTNKDYALSTPDPIAKVADVSGSEGSYLMAAVGNAMEWDNIIPYYGRHEIVKGSIYSYFEFPSNQLLNDDEWRKNVANQDFLSWLKPFITKQDLDYPATTGY